MSSLERNSHFEFGENWRAYASTIDERRISAAIAGIDPYETATIEELSAGIGRLGFRRILAFPMPVAAKGLFGSGCHEVVFSRAH